MASDDVAVLTIFVESEVQRVVVLALQASEITIIQLFKLDCILTELERRIHLRKDNDDRTFVLKCDAELRVVVVCTPRNV